MRCRTAIILFLVAIFFSGCILHTIPHNYVLKKEKESIVIGHLYFPETGIPYFTRPIYGKGGTLTINTLIGQDSRVYTVKPELIDDAYRFYVAMPQGRYKIISISWGEFEGDVNGIFTVYETGKVYYIGSIKLSQVEQSPGQIAASIVLNQLSGRRSTLIWHDVVDEYQKVCQYFKSRYPHFPHSIEKSMVVFKKAY